MELGDVSSMTYLDLPMLCSDHATSRNFYSKQDHANATPLRVIWHVALVDSSTYRRGPPVVQIVVQLPITSAELESLKE
jgi:hypothetical protein